MVAAASDLAIIKKLPLSEIISSRPAIVKLTLDSPRAGNLFSLLHAAKKEGYSPRVREAIQKEGTYEIERIAARDAASTLQTAMHELNEGEHAAVVSRHFDIIADDRYPNP